MNNPPKKNTKTMGKAKNVGHRDEAFEFSLKEMFGNKNASRILSKPSAMKRAYGMYLKSRLADFKLEYDEIPF